MYPGDNFDYHLKPFRAAIAAGAAQIMPYYGMPIGTQYEEVGFGYNKGHHRPAPRRTRFRRNRLHRLGPGHRFDHPRPADARSAWGVETWTAVPESRRSCRPAVTSWREGHSELAVQRSSKAGSARPHCVSVDGLLREVHPGCLTTRTLIRTRRPSLGKPEFAAAGAEAQCRAYTLLTTHDQISAAQGRCRRLYLGASLKRSPRMATVRNPADADVAPLRPGSARAGRGFEAMSHAGSLEFRRRAGDHQAAVCAAAPTIVDVYLDRPAKATDLHGEAAAPSAVTEAATERSSMT